MREIVHIQAGQCGNQIGAKVSSQLHGKFEWKEKIWPGKRTGRRRDAGWWTKFRWNFIGVRSVTRVLINFTPKSIKSGPESFNFLNLHLARGSCSLFIQKTSRNCLKNRKIVPWKPLEKKYNTYSLVYERARTHSRLENGWASSMLSERELYKNRFFIELGRSAKGHEIQASSASTVEWY